MTSNRLRIAGSTGALCALAFCSVLSAEAAGTPSRARETKVTPVSVAAQTVPAADPFGPIPSPHDSRNVQFVYEPSKIYTLLAQAGQLLHVELGPDEQIVTIQMSDPVRWIASRVENPQIAPRIFFKPTKGDIATSVSIVTTARKYELLLQSVPEGSYRYQQVTFRYPDVEQREEVARAERVAVETGERRRLESQEVSAPLAPEQLNWSYEIDGKASFRPDAVFDNGRFTYLTMAPNVQELPAVFMLVDGKRMQVVDYHRQGPYLVVQRLVDGLLLKLDEQEVRVKRRSSDKRSRSLFTW